MSLFAGATREELRQAYADAWRKRNAGQVLTPLEAMIADVIALHPEVHAVVEAPPPGGAAMQAGADPAENPYLHMGLHIAVREQVSVDRPPGVRELRRRGTPAHAGARRDAAPGTAIRSGTERSTLSGIGATPAVNANAPPVTQP
jgi:hypothetical protein